MAFLETPRFPDKLAFGLVVGPTDSRSRVRLNSGLVAINANWSNYITRFDGTARKTQAERDVIDAYFRAVRADGFRIKDFSDYQDAGAGVLTLIAGSAYQLGKTYTTGASIHTRKITKPVSTIAVAGGGTYTVDYTTGIVTKVSGATPTAWTGTFDVPVQFDHDELRWQILDAGGDGYYYEAVNLTLTEMRL